MSIISGVQSLEKNLCDIILFLKENSALINAHMVDFITDTQWNYLNINMQSELLVVAEDDLNLILSDDFLTPRRVKQFPHLCSFIQHANALTLKELGICKPLNDVLPIESTPVPTSSLNDVYKWHTKLKKQHEVQKMAFAISALAKRHDVSLVVDVGSGKGYLASYISHFHHLHVLGIEACSKRNQSAIIRDAKLSNMCKKQVGKTDNTVRHPDSINLSTIDNRITSSHLPQEACNYENNRYTCITKSIDATSDLQNIIIENVSVINSVNVLKTTPICCYFSEGTKERKKFNKTHQNNENKCSITDGKTSDIDRKRRLIQLNGLLCGLHTCGNLAVALIRQFVSCNLVSVLCCIGCCYNLLTEEFCTESEIEMDNSTDCGFPLSSVLRNKRFSLGRNARMLALQSKERMSHKKLQQSLFYRALLQVMLRDYYGVDTTTEIQVGRLAGKCHSFQDYVEKALTRLNFNHSNITSEKLDFYLQTYGTEEKKLQAFQMLRMVLAPCIETVILLDRLLFLHEQQHVEEAHLIQLFDPVISPRCYALVATKIK